MLTVIISISRFFIKIVLDDTRQTNNAVIPLLVYSIFIHVV